MSKRSTNFTKSEEERLIKLVLNQKSIIENKRTDAVSSKRKDEAWEKIEQEFNASSDDNFRNAKVLKEKYHNIKRTIRRNKAGVRTSRDEKNMKPAFLELTDVLGVGVEGMPAKDNNDVLDVKFLEVNLKECADNFEFSTVQQNDDEGTMSPKELEIDWTTYNLKMLNSKKNEILKTNNSETATIQNLKKKMLQQQLKFNKIEFEQKIRQNNEEHKLKMKIFEVELRIKEAELKNLQKLV